MTLSLVDDIIMREVDRHGAVVSLAALARANYIEYRNAHRRALRLAAAKYLTIERLTNAHGRPLMFCRHPESARQLTLKLVTGEDKAKGLHNDAHRNW